MVEVPGFTYVNEVYTVYTVQGTNRRFPVVRCFYKVMRLTVLHEILLIVGCRVHRHVATLAFIDRVGKRAQWCLL